MNKKKRVNVDSIRNPFEVQTYKVLQANARAGDYVLTYEEENIPYVLHKEYVPDFILEFPSGHKRYIEAKGYLRRDDMRKMIAVRQQYPGLDIKIFFAKDNKVNKNSRMRYSDWAIKNGFDHAVGVIPQGWFNE